MGDLFLVGLIILYWMTWGPIQSRLIFLIRYFYQVKMVWDLGTDIFPISAKSSLFTSYLIRTFAIAQMITEYISNTSAFVDDYWLSWWHKFDDLMNFGWLYYGLYACLSVMQLGREGVLSICQDQAFLLDIFESIFGNF